MDDAHLTGRETDTCKRGRVALYYEYGAVERRGSYISNKMRQSKRPTDGVYGVGDLKDRLWLFTMGMVVTFLR